MQPTSFLFPAAGFALWGVTSLDGYMLQVGPLGSGWAFMKAQRMDRLHNPHGICPPGHIVGSRF